VLNSLSAKKKRSRKEISERGKEEENERKLQQSFEER